MIDQMAQVEGGGVEVVIRCRAAARLAEAGLPALHLCPARASL